MNPSKNLNQILKHGERLTLECKRATNTLPNSTWETYSAFANTYGGTILLGIAEDLKQSNFKERYQIIGVDAPEKIITDFWNTINSNKVNENILSDHDVYIIDIDGKKIICINVPQADWRIKPIFLNENPYKGTYKRNHEGDYHCTARQVRAMIRDSFEDGNDGIILDHYDMEDIDLDSLHRYRNLFRVWNTDHIWSEIDDKTFLRNLGGYIVNKEEGREGLSVAGLMMFGKGLPIRERFDNFRMDYINFCNLIGDERYSDRLTYDGRWENNLYSFFSIVLPKMTFDLPRPFRMEGLQRVDDTPQHKAVREAFTNAIIHADLMLESGILRIEKHDDRLCFRNPGLLRLPIEKIYNGGNSVARNPRIQNMLRMVGFGENLGSGFPQIISAWKETNWGEPQLINKIDLNEVELVLPFQQNNSSFRTLNDTKNDTINDTKNDTLNKDIQLSDRQLIIIQLININDTITVKEIAHFLKVSEITIKRDLSVLVNKNLLTRHGSKKDGKWIILKQN